MKALLVEPIAESTPRQRKIIVLAMILQALMACNYQAVPMLFYRPKFYCGEGQTLSVCNQLDACLQTPLKFQSDYSFSSISMDFGLYCDRKKIEANILTLVMLGHFVGAIASAYLSDFGHRKRSVLNILLINALISGLCCLAGGLAQSPVYLGIAYTVWSFSSDMILSFLNMLPMLYFEAEKAKRVFTIFVISWSFYSVTLPAFVAIHLSWRVLLVVNLGVPFLIWATYLWRNMQYLAQEEGQIEGIQSAFLSKEQQAMPEKSEEAIVVSYGDLYASSHFKNIVLYFIVYSGSYMAAVTSLLTINGIAGNLYINLTITGTIEILLSFTGGYISHSFSVTNALRFIYLSLGISYGLYSILPSFLQFFVVIQGKLLTDITWVLLSNLTIMIAPPRFMPLIMTSRCILNIGVGLVLPYIKYFMELIRLSLFIFSSMYELTAYFCLRSIQTRDVSKL